MMARDYTLSFAKANACSLGLIVPILAIYGLPYGLWHGWAEAGSDLVGFFLNIPFFLVSVIAGAVVHEVIHALSWSRLGHIPWNNIQFGFQWYTMTPYVHCPDPVEIRRYRWAVAMPGLLLGVIPYLVALLFKVGWLFGFSFFFTLAASGDMLILWLLRDVPAGTLVRDHPNLAGCQVFKAE